VITNKESIGKSIAESRLAEDQARSSAGTGAITELLA
jgi:hypothetical protein